MFGTLQERLPKELKLAGITDIDVANRFLREVYLPAHNARFARSPQIAESAFVTLADPAPLAEILCIEDKRVMRHAITRSFMKGAGCSCRKAQCGPTTSRPASKCASTR